jgi:nucleotide-binding universal stress UspA family protein
MWVEPIRNPSPAQVRRSAAPKPVVLATLATRVDEDAERLAIDSCLDAGVGLIVVNAVPALMSARTLRLGSLDPVRENYEAVRETAERAAAFGIRVEHLRVTSPRPAKAIVQIANERGAGLLVLGAKRRRIDWRFDRAARQARKHAACLVWIPEDGPVYTPVTSSVISPR